MEFNNYLRSLLVIIVGTADSLSEAQFPVEPGPVVQAEGQVAMFECLYPGAASYSWRVNGNLSSDTDFPSDFNRTLPSRDTPATLSIPATPQYNNTIVQCIVLFREGGGSFRSMLSMNATLHVQGPLAAVTDISVSANPTSYSQLTISWSAPFSLNLTTPEPDIQYCLEVYNVTEGGNHHLDSVCGITDAQYTYTAPDPTGVYTFTVTPRSNIEGSLNGTTSQPVELSYVSTSSPTTSNPTTDNHSTSLTDNLLIIFCCIIGTALIFGILIAIVMVCYFQKTKKGCFKPNDVENPKNQEETSVDNQEETSVDNQDQDDDDEVGNYESTGDDAFTCVPTQTTREPPHSQVERKSGSTEIHNNSTSMSAFPHQYEAPHGVIPLETAIATSGSSSV